MISKSTNKDLSKHRKSGLTREFSTFDLFVFNTFGYSLGLALTTNPVFIGAFAPSANILLVLTLGFLASIVIGLVYGSLSTAMPRNGGDYVYVSRILSRMLGFLANWGFTVAQVYGLAVNCIFSINWALVPALYGYGVLSGNQRFMHAARWINTPVHSLLVALAYLCVVYMFAWLGTRFVKTVFIPLFILGLLGPILQGVVFACNGRAEFVARFDVFMADHGGVANAYSQVVHLSHIQAAPSMAEIFGQSFRAAPLGLLVFLGFAYSAYIGTEVLKPSKAQTRSMIGSLIFGASVLFIVIGLYLRTVGHAFNAGLLVASSQLDFPAGISVTAFANLLIHSKLLFLVINFGNVIWFAMVPVVIFQVCSRNIHAWSLDYLAPEGFSKTNERGFPTRAGMAVFLVASAFAAVSSYLGIQLVAAVALVGTCFVIIGFAAILFPKHRPDDFLAAPPYAQRRIGGLYALTWLGWLMVIICIGITYASMVYPEISGGTRAQGLMWVSGVYGVGLIFYLVMRESLEHKLRKEFLKMEDLTQSLPPE